MCEEATSSTPSLSRPEISSAPICLRPPNVRMIPPFRPLQKDTHPCSSPNKKLFFLTSQPHSLLINNDLYANEIMLIKQKHSMVVTLNGSVQTPDLFQRTFYLKRYLKQAVLNRFLLHVLVNRRFVCLFFSPPREGAPSHLQRRATKASALH